MHRHELAHWWGPGSSGPVELRIPAEAKHLPMVRAMAHSFCRVEGFTRDEVTDVVLAVDEAAEILTRYSAPGAILHCRCAMAFGRLQAIVSTTTVAGELPGELAHGWRVLTTVTDSFTAYRYEHDRQRSIDRVVHIEFAKSFARRSPG
ncbi:ATP-binding protein [Prauserella oleivorans]|uniref:ATP-binding protein n=1 Tax=Prauserella oleivorans TaxID=1478153 RepID=A0ABW5WAQ1_9PSEU